MEEDKTKFLIKAVDNYLRCLQSGDQHDMRIFRLTSLWFNNAADKTVTKLMAVSIKVRGSHVPLGSVANVNTNVHLSFYLYLQKADIIEITSA